MIDQKIAMPLHKALWILARAHTKEEPEVGFTILPCFSWHTSDVEPGIYAEAWRSVRAHLGLPIDPKDYTNGKEQWQAPRLLEGPVEDCQAEGSLQGESGRHARELHQACQRLGEAGKSQAQARQVGGFYGQE